jgi:hypothetical protein
LNPIIGVRRFAGICERVKRKTSGCQSNGHVMTAFPQFALVGFFVLLGCVPIQLQLHEDDLKLLTGNPTVYVITFKSPPFEVDTSTNVALVGGVLGGAGGAIGGVVGALAAGAAANAIDEANMSADIQTDPRALLRSVAYEDPVKQVRDGFVAMLRDELKMSKFVVVDTPLDDESQKTLGERFHDGIILGFKTEEWVLTVVPLSSDFWVKYRARGMFYLPQERRYIWRELCGFIPKDSTASLRDLAANSGEGLKHRLTDMGTRCAKQLAGEILERTSRMGSRDDY